MPTACCLFVLLALPFVAEPVATQQRREIPAFRTYGEPAHPEDAAAIDALLRRFKRAWARQDAETLTALHADDVEWINAYARMFQSTSALGDFLKHRLFPGFDPAVSNEEAANMRAISIRYLGSDAAIVHLFTDGRRGRSRNAEQDKRRTHLHFVLAKEETTWKIVHTVIMDAR